MPSKDLFSLKTFVSALIKCTFVMLVVASIALFLAPSCKVAKATGWSFLGITKDTWKALSALSGFLAVLGGVSYLVFNRNSLRIFFTKERRFTSAGLSALVICCVLSAGVIAGVAPFSYVSRWHESHEHGSACGNGCQGCSCGSKSREKTMGLTGDNDSRENGEQTSSCEDARQSYGIEQSDKSSGTDQ
jgi:hypothetical protein